MSYRVGIHTTLVSLREEIASQLSPSLLPGQYVFLRNLGRCFSWVSWCLFGLAVMCMCYFLVLLLLCLCITDGKIILI